MLSDPMNRLLADLAQEGRQESQGSFTLDPALAIRKLALFQQAEPAQFLSLVVQAAVLSGAGEIQIKFRDGGVVVTWAPDVINLDRSLWKDLPERLQQAALQSLELPADYVAAALQAALALDPLAVGWSFVGSDSSWAVMVAEDGLAVQEGPGADPQMRFSVRPRLEGGFFKQLRQRLTGHAEWHFSLVKRCGSCPIPIFVDGRRINWPLRGPSLSTMESLRTTFTGLDQLRVERFVLGSEPGRNLLLAPPAASRRFKFLDLGAGFPTRQAWEGAEFVTNYHKTDLFQLLLPGEGPFPTQPPPVESGEPVGKLYKGLTGPDPEQNAWGVNVTSRRVTLNQLGGKWLYHYDYSQTVEPGYKLWGYDPLLCHAMFSLDRDSTEPGKLIVVLWGVALDPVTVDLGSPGAVAIVAYPCRTDLSRLRPLQDEAFSGLVEYCRRQFAEMEADYARLPKQQA